MVSARLHCDHYLGQQGEFPNLGQNFYQEHHEKKIHESNIFVFLTIYMNNQSLNSHDNIWIMQILM